MSKNQQKKISLTKTSAYKFIILLGIVSLFADMTYEGSRSITGPYLAVLGANAATVGFVAGFGELVGYSLRLVSGYAAERTGRYWTIIFIGYAVNLLSVPLLALTTHWQSAAVLIVMERLGKAIRTPAREAILSYAGHRVGLGWAFGLHEALDQTGALMGPLLLALMLYHKIEYSFCFAILLVPALFSLIFLVIACRFYPNPTNLEIPTASVKTKGLNKPFWSYLLGSSLIAAGYADFSLVAFHFIKTNLFSRSFIALSYGIAMGVSVLAAPLFGRWYDRFGMIVLIIVSTVSVLFAPCVFLGDANIAIIGIVLWGIGMCSNESLMRAIVADMTPPSKRGSAYGIFNMGYGVFWFIGSVVLGLLYDVSIMALVAFSMSIQLIAIPILFFVMKKLQLTPFTKKHLSNR